jgi:hypothetical protein
MSTSSGHSEGSFIFTRAGVAGGANSDCMRLGADCLLPFLRGTDCGVCFSNCSFPFLARRGFSETFWAPVFFFGKNRLHGVLPGDSRFAGTPLFA